MIRKHCFGCGHPVTVPDASVFVMICPECFSIMVCRWDQASRPLHETDVMLMDLKTRHVLAWIAAESQLRQIAELEEIA